MEPEITVCFDKKGKTTITQNGVVFTMTIGQRLAFNKLIYGTIPVDYQIENEMTILPNGWIVEENDV